MFNWISVSENIFHPVIYVNFAEKSRRWKHEKVNESEVNEKNMWKHGKLMKADFLS